MTEVYKFPIPLGGQEIIFNIKGKQKKTSKFLFAKYSNKFHDFNYLKLQEYNVESDVSEDSFDSFLLACQGKPFFLTSENIYHFYKLADEFDTPSIKEEIYEYYHNNDHDSLVRDIIEDPNPDQKLIDSAASIFNKIISSEFFLTIDPNNIKQILENPNINIENHSEFFSFAKKYQQECNKKGQDSSFIFKYINLNELSLDEIYEYSKLEKCSDDLLSNNVLPIIKKLCESVQKQENLINKLNEGALKLSIQINETQEKLQKSNELKAKLIEMNKQYAEKYENCLEIEKDNSILFKEIMKNNVQYAQDNPLKGIFYNLKANCNNYKDQLEFILPDYENPSFPPSNLIETSPNFLSFSYYLKVDKPEDNWITFHLKNERVRLYGFTIRTNELGKTIALPKEFQIYGSNDNEQFDLLFEYTDDENILSKNGVTQFFKIEEDDQQDFYSYIRYRQTRGHVPYDDNERIISLSAFEIFGVSSRNK